jgi:hypothetical protein
LKTIIGLSVLDPAKTHRMKALGRADGAVPELPVRQDPWWQVPAPDLHPAMVRGGVKPTDGGGPQVARER